MPGPNTTGRPNTNDLWIGRGEVFIAPYVNGVASKAFRHLGNCPAFALTSAIETKEHFSSMSGLKSQDKSVVLSDARGITLQFEEMSDENQALFFSGDPVVLSGTGNAAVAGFTEYLMVADGDLEAGVRYEIKNSDGVRAMNVNGTLLTVKTNEGPPSVLVEGTDYDLDAEFGTIFLRADSTDSTDVTDAVTLGVGLLVTLTADAGAGDIDEVRGLTHPAAQYSIRFSGENAASGDRMEFAFHKVRLKATGDASLISEDWRSMSLEGAIESDAILHPASPYFDIRSLGETLPQITSIVFSYDPADTGVSSLTVTFDKAVSMADLTPAPGATGAIKFRTDATLTGDWVGLEGEYWLSATPTFTLTGSTVLLTFSFSSHATTLASAATATLDLAALGIVAASGAVMPVFGVVPVTSTPI